MKSVSGNAFLSKREKVASTGSNKPSTEGKGSKEVATGLPFRKMMVEAGERSSRVETGLVQAEVLVPHLRNVKTSRLMKKKFNVRYRKRKPNLLAAVARK